MLREKLRNSINRTFQKIKDQVFDEYDIKLLLIDLREFLREETFLREAADFIAHPERHRGICHKAINSRYAKMKMAEIGFNRLRDEKIIENNPEKPNNFFTDQVLDYIDPLKISTKDFKLFILDSIDDTDEKLYKKHYKLTKREVRSLLNKSYQKKDGFYELDLNIGPRNFLFLDDLLKFIRGTTTFAPVITDKDLEKNLVTALKRINKNSNISLPIEILTNNIKEIVLCILTLLHDSIFILDDGSETVAELSIHPERNQANEDVFKADFYTLMLKVRSSNHYHFPIITTTLDVTEYLEELPNLDSFSFKKLPWVNTFRDENGRLKLKESA